MALRKWRGVLTVEGEETGDGRLIVAGATEWPDPPLPLSWLQQEQHGDLLAGGVQVGTIDTIARTGNDITATGAIDDENPDGAELIRRLEAGSASHGARQGLSIDPDNWAVELIDTTMDETDAEEVVMLLASGSGAIPRRTLTAAAGDPDPGEGTGVLLFTDASGEILERYTRLRIRGVTACAVPAFAGAYLELEGEAAVEGEAAPEAEPARVIVSSAAARPPRAYFEIPEPTPEMSGMVDVYGMPAQELLVEQPDGGLAVPMVLTEDGRVFGHAARWGQCHVGYLDDCVTAPMSNAAYAHFHHGSVTCADGSNIATGPLSANCDHAAGHLLAPEARDHYAHSGMAWADVRASNGALGVWISGALRPGLTEDQLRVLRASSLSGDWRRIGVDLEFIGALAVNVPGFPIAREAVYASGMRMPRASLAASAHVNDGQVMSLVASGVVQRCAECAQRRQVTASADPRLDRVLDLLGKVELRTRHLVAPAAEHARHRLARR